MKIASSFLLNNQDFNTSELISKIESIVENHNQFTLIEKQERKLYYFKNNIYSFFLLKHFLHNVVISISESDKNFTIKFETSIIFDLLYFALILYIGFIHGSNFLVLLIFFPISLFVKFYFLVKLKSHIKNALFV